MSAIRTAALPAVIGGVVVAGAFLLAGPVKEKTTTVVRSPAAEETPAPVANPAQGLTAHEIYQRAAPGVVFVRADSVQTTNDPFNLFPQRQRTEETGSGFVIDPTGRILTNYHVISGAQNVTVQFEDNKSAGARVIGTDPSDDIALLKVDPSGLALRPLPLGESKTVQVGDPTLAIGNPFGLDRTLTSGIVSAKNRSMNDSGSQFQKFIQTDAAINPGNSGGPLLDSQGRVIGINSQIQTSAGGVTDTGGNVGIGFAVPIDTAKKVLPELEKTGTVRQAWMGIRGATTPNGAALDSVTGPSAKAGLRRADVITAIDGRNIASMDDVINYVESKKPGDRLTVTYKRLGKSQTTTLTLGTRPGSLSASR